jgi:hypothetical protein
LYDFDLAMLEAAGIAPQNGSFSNYSLMPAPEKCRLLLNEYVAAQSKLFGVRTEAYESAYISFNVQLEQLPSVGSIERDFQIYETWNTLLESFKKDKGFINHHTAKPPSNLNPPKVNI